MNSNKEEGQQKQVEAEKVVEQSLEIVRPIVKTRDAISDLKAFENLKSELLVPSDYQAIAGKNFVKKSGWRKLALVFNISDQVMDSRKEVRADGSFVWSFRVRATAPNGRFTEAVAACDSKERRFTGHVEHDVFATASTRAKSRAISDLIGAGEISAEELDGEDHATAARGGALEVELEEPDGAEEREARSFLQTAKDVTEKNNDERDLSQYSTLPADGKRFQLALGGRAYPVEESEAPFSRFFLNKICKGMIDKNPQARYELEHDGSNRITSIVWYGLDEGQAKEIENTLAWSVRKVSERRRKPPS